MDGGTGIVTGLQEPVSSPLSRSDVWHDYNRCKKLFTRIHRATAQSGADVSGWHHPANLVVSYEHYRKVLFRLAEGLTAARPAYPGLSHTYVYHYDPVPQQKLFDIFGNELSIRRQLMRTETMDNGNVIIHDIHRDLVASMKRALKTMAAEISNGPR